MDLQLEGRHYYVTGASRGVGRAIAEHIATTVRSRTREPARNRSSALGSRRRGAS